MLYTKINPLLANQLKFTIEKTQKKKIKKMDQRSKKRQKKKANMSITSTNTNRKKQKDLRINVSLLVNYQLVSKGGDTQPEQIMVEHILSNILKDMRF